MHPITARFFGLLTIACPLIGKAEPDSGESATSAAQLEGSSSSTRPPGAGAQDDNPFSTTGTFARARWRVGGFYAGAHVAYNFGSSRSALSFAPAATDTFGSLYGGLQLGYLLPLQSRFVVGIEGDVSFPNFLAGNDVVATLKSEHATYREQFDCLGTLRSRVGYAWNGQWLGYVTGGLVWSRARFSETPSDENTAAEKARWLTGYGLGLGTEAGIAQRWTARIEFVHDELVWGEAQFVSGVAVISKIHVNSLRLGLGWLP